MTDSFFGDGGDDGAGSTSAYGTLTDETRPNVSHETFRDDDGFGLKTCVRPGCSNTFRRPKKGDGSRRVFCDDHMVINTSHKKKVPEAPPIAESPGEQKPGTGEKKKPLFSAFEKKPGEPKPSARRVDTSDFWGDLVDGVSGFAVSTGMVPMGRAMKWTSPVAGDIIEEATRGGILDRLVQPIARNQKKYEGLGDLVGLWGAIGFMQQNPDKAELGWNFAKKRLASLLPRLSRKIVADRKKEKEAFAAIEELMEPEFIEMLEAMGCRDDPLEGLMRMFFTPPGVVDAASRETEESFA